MRGNFVHCHCSLWPGLLWLATENKTKKLQKLLSVWLLLLPLLLLLHLRSQHTKLHEWGEYLQQ